MKNRKKFRSTLFSVVMVCICLQGARAAEYEYPELLVTPLASERLDREAARERDLRWSRYVPIQLSALATLGAATVQYSDPDLSKDPDNRTPIVGFIAGGGWLATTLLMSLMYDPYLSGQKEVQVHTGSARTPKEKLRRERIAEEAITGAGRVGRRMEWISFASQATASVILLTNTQTGTLARNLDIVSLVMAFTPLFFRSSWEQISDQQQEYKKKIYAPIAFATMVPEPAGSTGSGNLAPFAGLRFHF
ncbi:hypothetical protein WDW86_05785 [Bdellovibrionota bacterium FG-2]